MRAGRLRAFCALLAVLAAGAACVRPEPPSAVIVIVVDTLRADHLGLYGYHRPTTPQLDARASTAVIFDNAFSTSSWTLPTFGSLLTGRLPSRHGAGTRLRETDWERSKRLDESLPTLPEVMREAGWRTGAIINNPWLEPKFGLNRGFESYDYMETSNQRLRRADQVVDTALAWIDPRKDAPFFLLVHLFDPHISYDAPRPFKGRYTRDLEADAVESFRPEVIREMAESGELGDGEKAWLAGAYDEEIAFVDWELGRFFAALEERGLWDRSLILLTSDHGEEFFEHDGFEHGHSMYQELVRVPLLIWGPGVDARRDSRPVSLLDVLPTVLDLAEIPAPEGLPGVSLAPRLRGRERAEDRSLIAEGTLYGDERSALVRWPMKLELDEHSGASRLFDLERDPAEREDVSRSRAEIASRMTSELDAVLTAARAAAGSEEIPLTEETIEELRAVGYLD